MGKDLDCTNFTYLTSHKDECEGYVVENRDKVCSEIAIRQIYSDACVADGQTVSFTGSVENSPIGAPYNAVLDPQTQISLLFFLLLIVLSILGYLTHTIARPFFDRKKKVTLIRLKFPNPRLEDEFRYINSLQSFFNSIHKLLKNKRLSIEIHKVSKRIELLIGFTDEQIGITVKNFLTSIDGITIEEVDANDDPLNKYKAWSSNKLVLSNDYYSINVDEKNFFRQLIDYLASLEDDQQAGVVITLRPTDKRSTIDKQLANRDKKLDTSRLNFEVYKSEKESLLGKGASSLFLTNLHIVASSADVRNGLSSLFNSLDKRNRFTTVGGVSKNELLKRYVPFENVFTSILRKNFGSFLNSQELAVIFHPSKLERGKYKSQETVVLEAEPDFLDSKDNNILIGRSIMKTGKAVNVYLPIENLHRHLYLAGSTGMGKSTVLIKLYIELAEKLKNTALVLFDPHGEDLLEIAYRIRDWEDVIYFNLAESTKTFTFNPLFVFRKSVKDKDNKVEQILKVLIEEAEKKNKDMGTSIEKLLKFLIQTAVHFPDAYYKYLVEVLGKNPSDAEKIVRERQITFSDLPHILQKNSGYSDVMLTVFDNYEEDIAIKWKRQLDNYMVNKAILDGVDNRLSFVVQDSLVDLFEGMSFDINEAIGKHKRILMPISEQSFGKISKKIVTKFLLNEMWSHTQSLTLKEDRQEVIVFIDEFQEAQLDIIDDLLSQARKYKIRLVFGNQFLGQLWENIRKSVLGNVSTLFSFKVQNLDEAETIAPMFKNKVTPEDIVSLPKFNAYLRTLNTEGSDDVAFMSFQTINYADEIKAVHNHSELQKLNEKCLSEYGEEKAVIKKRRLFKINNPQKYFLDLEDVN